MIIKRRDKVPKVSRYKYRVGDFKGVDAESKESAVSPEYCTYGYNIGFSNGALVNGIGINRAKVPIGTDAEGKPIYNILPALQTGAISRAYFYKSQGTSKMDTSRDALFVYSSDQNIYYTPISHGIFLASGLTSVGDVNFMSYRLGDKNVVLICSADGYVAVYDGVFRQYPSPKLTSVCMHYERLFGIDGADTIHFSNDLNPTDWEVSPYGAGYIKLVDEGGILTKILSFKDYIYVFREHSIYRLTAYTDPSEYRIIKIFETDQIILPETIVIADNTILFLADKTLYNFDGYTVTRFMTKATALIDDFSEARGSYYKNKYYLAARFAFKDGNIGDEEDGQYRINNGLLIADIQTGELSIFRGTDVSGLFHVVYKEFSALLCMFGNFRRNYLGIVDDSGTLFGNALKKLWRSPVTYFGNIDMRKTLRRVYITSKYGLTVETAMDGKTESNSIYGGSMPSVITSNKVGDTFSITLVTENDKIYVTSMQFELDFSRRYYAD